MQPWFSYLQLVRPANIVTAVADILAGYALATTIAPNIPLTHLFCLIISTMGLYAGGIIFNDIFDLEEDKRYNPTRPLPSGRLSLSQAYLFGVSCFGIALITAACVNMLSLTISLLIIAACLIYDGPVKPYPYLSSFVMGMCRALNLCLGMSIIPLSLSVMSPIALVPLLFITGVNLLSREEHVLSSRKFIPVAILLYLLMFILLLFIMKIEHFSLIALPVMGLFILTNIYPLYKIKQALTTTQIQEAVKAGVLSLILLDAMYCIGVNHFQAGFFILLLLPLTNLLTKFFYVT